jgi:ankyrin repeat protein
MTLAKNVDVNVRNKYGRTALRAAVEKCYKDLVKLLISKGVVVNTGDKNGLTDLQKSAGVQC